MNENNIINQSIEESRIDFIEWVIAIGKEKITILIMVFVTTVTKYFAIKRHHTTDVDPRITQRPQSKIQGNL